MNGVVSFKTYDGKWNYLDFEIFFPHVGVF